MISLCHRLYLRQKSLLTRLCLAGNGGSFAIVQDRKEKYEHKGLLAGRDLNALGIDKLVTLLLQTSQQTIQRFYGPR